MSECHADSVTLPPEMGAQVPPLPKGMDHLLQVLSDERLDFEDLVAEIELYPPVVARLLSLANSAWSAPVSPVTSLTVACGRLGLDLVRSVVLALTVAAPFEPARCPAFDTRRYWASALTTAEGASLVSQLAGIGDVHKARTAGLLRNVGLLWLADSRPEETGAALAQFASDEGQGLEALLQAHCGMGYLEAGEILAAYWELPPTFIGAAYASCQAGPESLIGLPLAVCTGSRLGHLLRGDSGALPELGVTGIDNEVLVRIWGLLQKHRQRLDGLAEQLCG